MSHEKNNPLCPLCHFSSQSRGTRRSVCRYQCTSCGHWFSVNHCRSSIDTKLLLKLHLDGVSFRSLADQFHLSPTTAYRICLAQLHQLPLCADVTRAYCTHFSGILLVDGKYISVKSYDRKIPVLYGIDYLTHDIPTFILSRAENYQTCSAYFNALKLLNYQAQALVCDDNINIYQAFSYYYPKATIQLCLNHYKEGLRQRLQVRASPEHRSFMTDLEVLFARKYSKEDFQKRAAGVVAKYHQDLVYLQILADIHQRHHYLLGYRCLKNVPLTTNLIESFNSHLQGRLKTIKGFESFSHAKLWLNGYFLRRRTKPFTDCSGKFKRLNGKTSLSLSANKNVSLPTIM